jgi:uncharacterized protein (TIGR02145 family)
MLNKLIMSHFSNSLRIITRMTFLLAFVLLQLLVEAQIGCTNTTTPVSSLTTNSAVGGGNVCSSTIGEITSRGICWSTSPLPVPGQSGTVAITKGSGAGSFTINMTGLSPGTKYYVRSFAVPTKGYIYGNELTFTTPALTTSHAYDITVNSARVIGNIVTNGGSQIVVRGVCWSTSKNPTVALTTKTSDGSSLGSFSSKMSNLLPNTTYFARTFFINQSGLTYYSDQISFRTEPTITIGTQVWTQKNLNVTHFLNGDIIPEIKESDVWRSGGGSPAWCWYKNDSITNAATCGRLYTWYAVKDPRGLCPAGWHVPKADEWTQLLAYLGGDAVAAPKMRATPGWFNYSNGYLLGNTTNSSGFSAYPGGRRQLDGAFEDGNNYEYANNKELGRRGYWWSTSYLNNSYVLTKSIHYSYNAVETYGSSLTRTAVSVRCVKD